MKFQDPRMHVSIDVGGLNSVGRALICKEGKTSQMYYAPSTFSELGS